MPFFVADNRMVRALGRVSLVKKEHMSLGSFVEDLKSVPDADMAGAIACFIGRVRSEPVEPDAGRVRYLDYEAYEDVARQKLEEIRREMVTRRGVVDVTIHHVIDTVPVGEDSLFVAVMGKHRQDVFPVLADTVERVKRDVPIWKKEITDRKSYWVTAGTNRSPKRDSS